ncbi:MAG: AAA family ATPase, partial [Gammaproteobacteria bacterium]
ENLAEIGRLLLRSENVSEIRRHYRHTVAIWRSLVDKSPGLVSYRDARKLPELPLFPAKLLSQIGDTPESLQYRESYQEAQAFRSSLQEKIASRIQEGIESYYRVLLQSGDIRSQLINQLLDQGDDSPLALSAALLQDIRREFAIVPYRWRAIYNLRVLDIQQNLSKGWEGWREIAGNILVLAVFLMIPALIWLSSKRLAGRMIRWRSRLVHQSRAHPWARELALAIQKILPYTSWLIMLLILGIAQYLLAQTIFSELALLLPYFRYYIYFRLFRQLMQCDFIWVDQQIRAAKLSDLRRRIDIAAQMLGLSAFLIFSLLYAIASLIRRGLFFHLAAEAMFYLGLLMAFWFACQWREILGASLSGLVPWAWGQRLAELCKSRYGLILSLPVFIVILLSLAIREIMSWGGRFEFFKKIATEIFRYQLESAAESKPAIAGKLELQEEYLKWFALTGIADPELLLCPRDAGFKQALEIPSRWEGNPLGNSLAVVGNRGAGKTCLLNYLQQNLPGYQFVFASVPPKLTTRHDALDFLGRQLNISLTDQFQELLKSDSVRPKTVVLIDDAHNLFLSRQGAFEGFNAMLELINLPTQNLFWCLAFNRHAWDYLNSVYARHQFFGSVVTLQRWPEQDIQTLILSLHGKSGFKLSYDDIIHATGSHELDNILYIENRFFRLLSQQSRGNPRLAVYLWLSALHRTGKATLRVGLPVEAETGLFSEMSEDSLFVYASLARHENLTLSQAVEVTQLPEGTVRHTLEFGMSQKLLECRGAVFKVAPLYQYPLIQYLLAKHFIYE